MMQPLALILYERLLPGTQLVNRLQDLSYRVQTLNDPGALVASAEKLKPMVVLADLESKPQEVCEAISRLRQHPPTQHLPVIAFGGDKTPKAVQSAKTAGVTLLAGESALLSHLPQFLDQALQVE